MKINWNSDSRRPIAGSSSAVSDKSLQDKLYTYNAKTGPRPTELVAGMGLVELLCVDLGNLRTLPGGVRYKEYRLARGLQ